MGCGKSKLAVAAENTIMRKKYHDQPSNNNNNDDAGPFMETSTQENHNIIATKELSSIGIGNADVQDLKIEVVDLQDDNKKNEEQQQQQPTNESKKVQTAVKDRSHNPQQSQIETKESSFKSGNVKAAAEVQDDNEGEQHSNKIKDESIKQMSPYDGNNPQERNTNTSVLVQQEERQIENKESSMDSTTNDAKALGEVQDVNVKTVAMVKDVKIENDEEFTKGGNDVKEEEESVVKEQEAERLISEASIDVRTKYEEVEGIICEERPEKFETHSLYLEPGKESLSNESAKLDDVAKQTLVEETKKGEPEVVEEGNAKQEVKINTTIEPEITSPTSKNEEISKGV